MSDVSRTYIARGHFERHFVWARVRVRVVGLVPWF